VVNSTYSKINDPTANTNHNKMDPNITNKVRLNPNNISNINNIINGI